MTPARTYRCVASPTLGLSWWANVRAFDSVVARIWARTARTASGCAALRWRPRSRSRPTFRSTSPQAIPARISTTRTPAASTRTSGTAASRAARCLTASALVRRSPAGHTRATRVCDCAYPGRSLVPFACRQDNDDVACWDLDQGRGRVVIVHDFKSPGGRSGAPSSSTSRLAPSGSRGLISFA